MLAKCANPSCTTEFKYFRHGRLFEFNLLKNSCYDSLPPQKNAKRELFWLCHDCSRNLTLECDGGQVTPVPRTAREHRAA